MNGMCRVVDGAFNGFSCKIIEWRQGEPYAHVSIWFDYFELPRWIETEMLKTNLDAIGILENSKLRGGSMSFYPFMNVRGNQWGSFETIEMNEYDPQWTDPDTWMGELVAKELEEQLDDKDTSGRKVLEDMRTETEMPVWIKNEVDRIIKNLSGWYWQAGFPGCIPDGEPIGPFETEMEAIADAWDMPLADAERRFEHANARRRL